MRALSTGFHRSMRAICSSTNSRGESFFCRKRASCSTAGSRATLIIGVHILTHRQLSVRQNHVEPIESIKESLLQGPSLRISSAGGQTVLMQNVQIDWKQFLNRPAILVDDNSIQFALRGKRILITGAGG